MEPYQRFTVTAQSAEDALFELHELGALGTEMVDEQSFHCFFPDDTVTTASARDYCLARGWICSEIEKCAGQNWVQACAEVWLPLTVGRLSIYPLLNEGEREEIRPDTIYIIPGEGFGTGHHPSTRLAMQMVQYLQYETSSKIATALDFGTGNGILAIATSMAFPSCAVSAIDNDPSAIPNASENVALNHREDRITLSVNSIENMDGQYDLITANIYAEVLCAHESQMMQALNPGGHLILAGIMDSRAYLIREKFLTPDWRQIQHLTENGWESFLLQRV